jgi:hypothetical protein
MDIGVADMEVAIGFGWKARVDAVVATRCQILSMISVMKLLEEGALVSVIVYSG